MSDYKVSNSVVSSIEYLIANASHEDILKLLVLDNTNPDEIHEEVDVDVQVITPFNNNNLHKVAIIRSNFETRFVELYGASVNDDIYAIVKDIMEHAFAYSQYGHDTTNRLTFRSHYSSQKYIHYYYLVKERATDLNKTTEELLYLTEGLFMFATDFHLTDKEVNRFMRETEDDCLVWDALNGTYTNELEEYVYDKLKTNNSVLTEVDNNTPAPTDEEDENIPDTIYQVRQSSTVDFGTVTTSTVNFTFLKDAEVFLSAIRDTLITDTEDTFLTNISTYPKEVIDSDDRTKGILIDNDREFYITDGNLRSDHLTIQEVPVFNKVEL